METCGVVPNEFSMGRSALMFTSMQFGSAMSLNAFLYKVLHFRQVSLIFDFNVKNDTDRRKNLSTIARKWEFCSRNTRRISNDSTWAESLKQIKSVTESAKSEFLWIWFLKIIFCLDAHFIRNCVSISIPHSLAIFIIWFYYWMKVGYPPIRLP